MILADPFSEGGTVGVSIQFYLDIELFQSELFWRLIFMQIRRFKVMNFDSLQSQLSSHT